MKIIQAIEKAKRVYVRLPRELPVSPLFETPVEGMFSPSLMPSAVKDPESDFQFICRQHYYEMDHRGIMIGRPIFEKTLNWLHHARWDNGRVQIVSREPLQVFQGVEDIRLYDHQGWLYLTATRPDYTGKKYNYPVAARAAKIDAETREGDLAHFDLGPRLSPIEKNWVYFSHGNEIYLERFPGMKEYYEIDTTLRIGTYRQMAREPFNWSGTKSVRWRGGNLFLDHKRVYVLSGLGTVMRFIYRFRFQSAPSDRPVLSREFSLLPAADTTVYASDMAIVADRLWIGVGIGDRVAQFLTTPLAEVSRRLGI
ncbi:MAG: hypothetical protein K2X41_04280 [Hyphomicrobium sp.]|nr:hypothetical protein [Hyphomicrobium sp.]